MEGMDVRGGEMAVMVLQHSRTIRMLKHTNHEVRDGRETTISAFFRDPTPPLIVCDKPQLTYIILKVDTSTMEI